MLPVSLAAIRVPIISATNESKRTTVDNSGDSSKRVIQKQQIYSMSPFARACHLRALGLLIDKVKRGKREFAARAEEGSARRRNTSNDIGSDGASQQGGEVTEITDNEDIEEYDDDKVDEDEDEDGSDMSHPHPSSSSSSLWRSMTGLLWGSDAETIARQERQRARSVEVATLKKLYSKSDWLLYTSGFGLESGSPQGLSMNQGLDNGRDGFDEYGSPLFKLDGNSCLGLMGHAYASVSSDDVGSEDIDEKCGVKEADRGFDSRCIRSMVEGHERLRVAFSWGDVDKIVLGSWGVLNDNKTDSSNSEENEDGRGAMLNELPCLGMVNALLDALDDAFGMLLGAGKIKKNSNGKNGEGSSFHNTELEAVLLLEWTCVFVLQPFQDSAYFSALSLAEPQSDASQSKTNNKMNAQRSVTRSLSMWPRLIGKPLNFVFNCFFF